MSVHPQPTTVERILTELQPLFDSLDDLAATFSQLPDHAQALRDWLAEEHVVGPQRTD